MYSNAVLTDDNIKPIAGIFNFKKALLEYEETYKFTMIEKLLKGGKINRYFE